MNFFLTTLNFSEKAANLSDLVMALVRTINFLLYSLQFEEYLFACCIYLSLTVNNSLSQVTKGAKNRDSLSVKNKKRDKTYFKYR